MIEFKDVTKKFASEPVLDKINFLIDKGSFVYLVGPTGSGKTTIFRLIIRDILPSEGTIALGDWDLLTLPRSKVPHLRRRVGVVFQDLRLLMDRTVSENVMLPLEFSGMSETEAREKAEKVLSEVGLAGKFDQFPLQLSGGERQRVAIARALVFEPEIILADEPTGNLDIETSFQIIDLLKSIKKRGATIFIATHNEKFLNKASDRIIALERGKIVQDKGKKSKTDSQDREDEKKDDSPKEKDEGKNKTKPDQGSSEKDKINLEDLAKKDAREEQKKDD